MKTSQDVEQMLVCIATLRKAFGVASHRIFPRETATIAAIAVTLHNFLNMVQSNVVRMDYVALTNNPTQFRPIFKDSKETGMIKFHTLNLDEVDSSIFNFQ